MKKFILLLVGVFMTIMCLTGIFSLSMLLQSANFQQGKAVVVVIFLLMIIGFGLLAIKCFKSVFHREEKKQHSKTITTPVTEISTHSMTEEAPKCEDKSTTPVLDVNIVRPEAPQEILDNMRMYYTGQQASNDMRIINESLDIMEKTPDIDTFLSRYDTAMRCALTLEQAKRAGVPIALQDGFSQSLVNAKNKALAEVLYRSFEKELSEIDKLKTENGKLNRINKYQEKLEGMYEDVFEFVAEDAYNDVMRKLEYLKNNH